MNNKFDGVNKQNALTVYNIDQINSIPDDQIQFVINKQLFLELRDKSISFSSYKKMQQIKKQIINQQQKILRGQLDRYKSQLN